MSSTARPDDFENMLTLLSLLAVLAIGGVLGTLAHNLGSAQRMARPPPAEPLIPDDPAITHEVQFRFDQGVALLHAKRYEYAATAFARVIELAPRLPEAYVNFGFALLGQQHYEEAGAVFNKATELRPNQANAYWGLALALEGMKDYEGALGAMRSYIHLSRVPDDPYVTKARSALWEWEAQLGRIKGVTPTAEGEQADIPATPPQAHSAPGR